jgi:hypothetical protein
MTSLSTTSFAGYTFGTWYPTGYIVALTREYTDAVGLQQALQQAGIEDVEVWRADEVYANYTAYRLQRSMMERMIAVLATDERAIQDDNLQAAQEGYTFLTIPVSDPTRLDELHQLLITRPIYRAHYYGRYTMRDLKA